MWPTDTWIGWFALNIINEFRMYEQASGVGDGQGSLACGSPWGHKESDMTEQLTLSLVSV